MCKGVCHTERRMVFSGWTTGMSRRGFNAWHSGCAQSNSRVPSVTVSLFAALKGATPREVTTLPVWQCVVMVCLPVPPCPRQLAGVNGHTPLCYGTASGCDTPTRQLLQDWQELDCVELKVYLRPRMTPIRAKVGYGVQMALLIGKPEELTPGVPNYVSLDEADCMGEGNPPLPLLDFFVHTLCRPPKPDEEDKGHWVAIFTGTPVTGTHWALVATSPVDVLLGLATEEADVEGWSHAAMATADEPIPPGLEGTLRHRVQALLWQGIPAWAGLEDALLRESWERREREREQAKAAAKAAAMKAATAKAKAKAKAKEEEPKAEEEMVDLPPEVIQPDNEPDLPPSMPNAATIPSATAGGEPGGSGRGQ